MKFLCFHYTSTVLAKDCLFFIDFLTTVTSFTKFELKTRDSNLNKNLHHVIFFSSRGPNPLSYIWHAGKQKCIKINNNNSALNDDNLSRHGHNGVIAHS